MKNLFIFAAGLLSAIYLLNPGFGLFDFIPDNLPLVGNLDEAGATAVLLSSLAYFGFDLTQIFTGHKNAPTALNKLTNRP